MNNGEIKIEHGIPMPEGKGFKSTRLTKALEKMKVGDSIVIPKADRARVGSSAHYRDMKIKTRILEDDHSQIRVWRIK